MLNDAGQTAFVGFLTGNGTTADNDSGLWSEGQGNGLALVARAGDAAPWLGSGVTFDFFGNTQPRINNNGATSIRAFVLGDTNFDTIWTEGADGLNLVAQAGNIAPGTGVPWTDFNFSEPVFNDNGQVAFSGGVFVTNTQQFGIWRGTPGNITAAVLPNSQAPGTASGVVFDAALSPVLNNNGQVAFLGVVSGTGVNLSNNAGIWTEGGGNGLALVAREGSAAAGTGAGVVFDGLSSPIINDAGDTIFRASLDGTGVDATNDVGIWKDPSGTSLELVVRKGDQAVGTQAGVTFELDFNTTNSLSLNDAGQIAFLSALGGTGVDSTNDRGIFAEDLDGNLQLIAREGDLLEVFDDQQNSSFRTIDTLLFTDNLTNSGNSDGRPSSFNDLGQLVFFASFTDGTEGIFVSNLVSAVPEPGSIILLSLLPCLLFPRKRQTAG